MSFVGCLLGGLISVFVVFVVLGLQAYQFLRQLLGLPPKRDFFRWGNWQQKADNAQSARSQSANTQSRQGTQQKKTKVFADNEGEYVDFEEVN